MYPIVIHCVADEGPEESKQSHSTICVVDHHSDGTYGLRALKQKIFVDGLCYLLQEIYGIENKCNNKVRSGDSGRVIEKFNRNKMGVSLVSLTGQHWRRKWG